MKVFNVRSRFFKAHTQLLTTNYQLPNTNYQLSTINYRIPTTPTSNYTIYTNYTNYQKYVNSSCEMILNPTAQWFQKGVFTDLIKEYIFKTPSVPWFVKVQTISYLGTQ